MSDKKISDLPLIPAINSDDISLLVSDGTDYKFAFATLLQFIGSNLSVGANISFGTTLPQNTIGKNGDVFIKTNTGAFAQKIAGTWTVVYTLPSSDGLTDGTVLYGLGAPGNSTGNNNDTYINTATGIFYKKSAGTWNQVFSMQTGPQGPQGTTGTNGTNGANGFSVLNGTNAPSNLSTGVNGDFYINTTTYTLFGPKTGGNWGTGVSLVGIGLEPGGSTGQVLAKSSNDDYDIEWVNPLVINDSAASETKVYSSQKTTDLIGDETIARAAADTTLQGNIDSKQDTLGFTPEDVANKNNANGYAGLDGSGKVAATQLPSYVDDVLEFANFAALPATGETGKIYVTLDDNAEYRWSGSIYIQLVASPGSTDAVPEGSTNKYFTATRVLTTILTGIGFSTATAVSATDTILAGLGKLQAQITALFKIPTGGTAGQILAKVDDVDGNVEWIDNNSIPAGGAVGQILAKVDNTDYNVEWQSPITPSNGFGVLFYSPLISWDFSLRKNQSLVLYGNTVIQINNMNDGDVALLILKQDEIGDRSVSFVGDFRVAGSAGGEIGLSTDASAEDSLYILKKGSTFYVQVYKNYVGIPLDLSPTFLDSFSSHIKAAFSTSKLFSTSTNCVRIRRDSDNTEQDFGFVDGNIDLSGISAFIDTGNGYVVKWYDQSINAAHYVQNIQANQPKLKLNSLNGLPSLEFDGSSSYMTSGAFLDSSFSENCTFFTLAKKYISGFFLYDCAADATTYFGSRSTATQYGGPAAIICPPYKNIDTELYLDTYKYDGANAYAYVNNAKYLSTAKTGSIPFTGAMTLGSIVGGGFWWNGEIHAKIYMNSALAENDLKLIGHKLATDYGLVALPHINFDGNSLTRGVNSSSGDDRYPGTSYPSQLIQAIGGTSGLTFTNQGQNGGNIEQINSLLSGSNIYNTNGFASKLIDIFWEGRNSISTGDTAIQAYNAMITYLTKYKALGWKIAVLTCQPVIVNIADPNATNVYGVSTNSCETERLLYNQMLRDNVGTIYDYLIDIVLDERIGDLTKVTDTTYWDSGGIHMTDAGYLIIAQLVADTLSTILYD